MPIPESLKPLVHQAKAQLTSAADGRLRLGLRQLIWNELGRQERKAGKKAVHHTGLKRRFHLAKSCAERVLSYWQAVFPEDEAPAKLLEMAKDYINGKGNYGPTRKKWIDFAGNIEW